MHSNEQTSSSDEDFSKMMRYAYVFRVPAPVLMVKMRKKRRKSKLSLQTRKITFTKLFSMFFMIRAKLRQKRARIFEDSDDSDVVEFPETIFHEGNELGDNSQKVLVVTWILKLALFSQKWEGAYYVVKLHEMLTYGTR